MGEYEEILPEEIESGGSGGARGRSSHQTTLDRSIFSEPRQTTLNSRFKKEEREAVVRKIGRFIYGNGLSFNVVDSPYWKEMVEGIGAFGKGLKLPSVYELKTRVLKAEVENIDVIKAAHKASWEKFGCTIMSDGWTDQRNRSLINFLVNSPEGTFFYKFIDASDTIKN